MKLSDTCPDGLPLWTPGARIVRGASVWHVITRDKWLDSMGFTCEHMSAEAALSDGYLPDLTCLLRGPEVRPEWWRDGKWCGDGKLRGSGPEQHRRIADCLRSEVVARLDALMVLPEFVGAGSAAGNEMEMAQVRLLELVEQLEVGRGAVEREGAGDGGQGGWGG